MEVPKKTVSNEAMQEEWALIKAAQQNPAQFRPLYNAYFEPIFRFIYRRTANEALASDICSQVFLKAIQKLPGYQFKGVPFSAWLFRIAGNEVAQHFRNTRKTRVISIDTISLNGLIDEIENHHNESLQQAMLQALDQLKETDIQLIEMRFFEQRPFKEIADITGLTESNAKVKTYRILEKLKKTILKIQTEGGRAPEL